VLRNRRRLIRLVVIAAAVGLLVALGALLYAVIQRNRTVTLPSPTGKYAIGRILDEWTDESRPETLGTSTGQYRRLTVWIWYPADPPPGGAPAPYLPKAWAHARDHMRGLGSILFQSLASIRAHAFANAPVSGEETTYPVLIFEPGLGPTVSDYTTLLEDLASHGYIIIGVNPTYSASAVVFVDGRVVEQSASGNIPDNASVPETKQIADRLVHIWADDMIFAMDQAQRLNADPQSLLAGRMDLTRIGVFGHSFGGAAAAEVCHLDVRCQAGADLDGYPYGDVVQIGLRQPFLFVWSTGNDSNDAHYQQAVQDIEAIYSRLETGYQVTIRGARHFNFTDYAVEFSPALKLLGVLGSIDGERGLQISRAYVLAFFDTALKDAAPSELQRLSTDFPEVTFEAR
jgi:predicted dienelactone hydrolase